MNAILGFLDDLSTSWWIYTWHSTWQSALVGGVLLAVVYLGRRWPAPLRCGLLLLALAKFAVLPTLSIPTGLFGLAGPTIADLQEATPELILPAETFAGFEAFRAPESMAFRSIPQAQQPFSTELPGELAAAQTISRSTPPFARATAADKFTRLGWTSVLLMLHLAGSLVALVHPGPRTRAFSKGRFVGERAAIAAPRHLVVPSRALAAPPRAAQRPRRLRRRSAPGPRPDDQRGVL